MTEEKIPVPASWKAASDQEAQRRESVAEWRRYLSSQQRKALDEEGPSAGFKTKIPLDKLREFAPGERDELMAHEEAEFRRFKPLAEARATQRTAWAKAGGDEAEFDEAWEAGGREMTIAEIASGGSIEPSPGQFSSAYE